MKETPTTKDWLVVGAITGVAGSAAKAAANFMLSKKNIPTVRYGRAAGSRLLGKRENLLRVIPSHTENKIDWAIGYAADAMLGGAFGAGLGYVFSKTAPGNEFFKGAAGGGAMWAATLSLGNKLRLSDLTKVKPRQMASMLAVSLLIGGMQGILLKSAALSLAGSPETVQTENDNDKQFYTKRRTIGRQRPKKQDAELPQYDPSYIH
ncbi:MAG: hypothetical protein KGZ79_08805 [Dethiobacter sp.]|jgi:hypothetical protein|nr:hypothetical protein [Dethiobacter sp.]